MLFKNKNMYSLVLSLLACYLSLSAETIILKRLRLAILLPWILKAMRTAKII